MKKFTFVLTVTLFLFASLFAFADSPRKVLIEEATNTSCGPCAAQNPTFQLYINNNFKDVIPLVYHAWWPGSNDPMYLENTVMNEARIRYYGIEKIGVPNVRVNGKIAPKSSGWYDGAAGDTVAINTEVNKYRGTNSPVTMTVAETRNGTQCSVSVTINTTQSLVGKKLRVAVVEYYISYPNPPGTNGEKEFFWVARQMLPDHNGTTLDLNAGSNKTYNFSYTIKSTWKAQQIYIVAFIQDDNTKEVLQAAQNLKVAKVQVTGPNPFLTIPRNGTVNYTFNVTNPSSELMRVNVALNSSSSYIPTSWNATLSTNQLILQPNQSQSVTVTLKAGSKAEFSIVGVDFIPNVQIPYEQALGYFYALTEDTKYAFYALTNSPSPIFAYQAILTNSKYANDAALLPFALDVINSYSMANFDLAVLGFNFALRGVLGGYYVESSPLYASLNSMISAGKSILLTSEVDLSFAYGTQGSQTARDFYTNKLFINKAQEPVLRITVNSSGQITNINPYPATGVTGDPIGNGINLTMNQYNQSSHPYFIVYTDILQITNPSKAKAFLFYDNNPSAIGGVRVENGNSRLAYLTTGFEGIANPTQRNGFANKIIDWLLNKQTAKTGPQIALSLTAIDFAEVVVGTTASQTFDISNTGDEPLIINELYIDRDFDPDTVFNIQNPPALPLTIQPNQKYTVTVTFTPKAESVAYTSSVIIKSNAKNAPNEIVSLDGIGVVGDVPIIASSKTEINFGEVQVESSKVGDVDITNNGYADLQITSVQIVNSSGAFSIMNPPELPATLGPGQTMTISILFRPTAAIDYSATLRIQSNASNQPTLDVPLTGRGTTAGSVSESEFPDGTKIAITPIPVGNELTILATTKLGASKEVSMKVYDLNGNLIADLGTTNLSQSITQLRFSTHSIPSGRYNLKLQIGNDVQFIPFIVVK
jgi:hypothetical protein